MSLIASLPLFHRIAGQQVLVMGDGAAAEPKRRLVERAGGVIVEDFSRAVDEGVRLAFIAYDDARACDVAAINARCAGMLVNVVDRPELCDFTTPSILDRDPLLIAIGTGGASAGLAKHVRLRLERVLPATLGLLARALEAARPALRMRFPEGAARRRALDAALSEGGPLDPFNPQSFERVEDWISDNIEPQPSTIMAFTLTSADPDELTLRQARLLGEADLLLIDGAVPPAILGRARADAARQRWQGETADLEGIRPGPNTGKAGSSAARPDQDAANMAAGMSNTPPAGPPPGLTLILHWRPAAPLR